MKQRLLHNDALDFITTAEESFYDLIVLDPPVNKDMKIENYIDYNKLSTEIHRVLKKNGWLFYFDPDPECLRFLFKLFDAKFDYVWLKPDITSRDYSAKLPFKRHETILAMYKSVKGPKKMSDLTFNKEDLCTVQKRSVTKKKINYKKLETYQAMNMGSLVKMANRLKEEGQEYIVFDNKGKKYPDTILNYPQNFEGMWHPRQKPFEILDTIIRGYTKKEDNVLDLFAGSGFLLYVASLNERKATGVELNKEQFDLSTRKLLELEVELEEDLVKL